MPSLEELMREVERTHAETVDMLQYGESVAEHGGSLVEAHKRYMAAHKTFDDACANLRDALGLAPARRDVV